MANHLPSFFPFVEKNNILQVEPWVTTGFLLGGNKT